MRPFSSTITPPAFCAAGERRSTARAPAVRRPPAVPALLGRRADVRRTVVFGTSGEQAHSRSEVVRGTGARPSHARCAAAPDAGAGRRLHDRNNPPHLVLFPKFGKANTGTPRGSRSSGARHRPGTVPKRRGRTPLGRYYEWWAAVAAASIGPRQPGGGVPGRGGAVGLDYLNVQQRAAKLTASVVYDRAGTGGVTGSTCRGRPRRWPTSCGTLRTAGVAAPCLLAGRSCGGFYAPPLSPRFPGEVAGLLLEPAHEDYNAYLPQQLTSCGKARDPDQALPDELPDELIQFYRGCSPRKSPTGRTKCEPLIERHVARNGCGWFPEAKNAISSTTRSVTRADADLPLIVLPRRDR